ncbi:RNA 2',3'-cyclic phosphodiesterase [Cellulomonas sp. NPDC089187]|uniref:RNA 2',3'-cyclic phosphodiesterase n=1 Tax=Cellulomonas sp. NPDC089187 TaxID=3154970 RepID=UPI00343BA0E8
MRLFAALWPTEEVRAHLAATLRTSVGVDPQSSPGRGPDGIRWTAAECWHITLAFYGEVGDGRAEHVAEGLGTLTGPPFDLWLRGAGVFAQRTLWAGVGGDLEAVHRLSTAARGVGEDCGIPGDHRVRSRPHVTLGRVAPGPRHRGPSPADRLVHALSVYAGPVWPVDTLVLARSEPGRGRAGGPLYTVLDRWEL